MPSTYTLNNGIELIATGEQSGTWGDTTNTNMSLLDTALDGQITVTLSSAGTSGSPNTLDIQDGAASDGRNRMVTFSDGADLGATAYVQLTPNDAEKIVYIRNALSGSRSILVFQGTYSASNDYEIPAGTTAVVYFNGAGTGAVAANVFNNAYFDSLRLGSVSVDKILDEDNMASDDASALATQQSIKAYVDSQVTAQDLDFAGDSGTGAVDLDSQTFTVAGTANEIETSASGQTLTVGLPNDVTITQDLTVGRNLDVSAGSIKLDGDYPTGSGNVALGNAALNSVAAGNNFNVAVGTNALTALTGGTGGQNTAVGWGSLGSNTASNNTAFGTSSLNANTTGSNNTGLGLNTLVANTTGGSNTAVGTGALLSATTANNNTVVGRQAADAVTTGSQLTVLGKGALGAHTTGSYNIAIG
jgi:hypothetical protein